jgi:hypothetical protein
LLPVFHIHSEVHTISTICILINHHLHFLLLHHSLNIRLSLLDGREHRIQVSPCCCICTDVGVVGVLLTPDVLCCALCVQIILTCVHSCTHINTSYLSSTASGRCYYANRATGETSWEPPLLPPPPLCSATSSRTTSTATNDNATNYFIFTVLH